MDGQKQLKNHILGKNAIEKKCLKWGKQHRMENLVGDESGLHWSSLRKILPQRNVLSVGKIQIKIYGSIRTELRNVFQGKVPARSNRVSKKWWRAKET